MSRALQRCGSWGIKPVTPGVDPLCLVARSEAFRAAGLRTPATQFDAGRNALLIEWIDGQDGGEVLSHALPPPPFSPDRPPPIMARLLRPLADLHTTPARGLSLAPFEPGRRIVPRLLGPHPIVPRAAELWRRLSGAVAGAATPAVPLHGDFHIGQLLFAAEAGEVWLLDLDDMASGPPEADLANFVAHLATCCDLFGDRVFASHALIETWVLSDVSWCTPEPSRLALFGATALVRRALKLAERGAPHAYLDRILDAAERVGPRA